MLITLPGPGGSAPPAIDVEVLQPAPVLPKHLADPATTSALPKVEDRQPSAIEVAPDDMPQQIANPDASAPAGIDALTPEPLAPTLVMAPALAPPVPEEVKQVTAEPDAATTFSIVPVATNPEAEELGEPDAAPGATAPSETVEPEPQPEIARADPKEETPPQGAPEEDAAEAETPAAPRPVAKPVAGKKPAPQATPKAEASAKAKAKPEPAVAKKRPTATAKRTGPQARRVVKGRPQTTTQGIMSFFGSALKPPAGANASARRPVVRQ
jgi:hypothetical protein